MPQTKIEKFATEQLTKLVQNKKLRVQIFIRKTEFEKLGLETNVKILEENIKAQVLNELYKE